jgi:hypothetical protein
MLSSHVRVALFLVAGFGAAACSSDPTGTGTGSTGAGSCLTTAATTPGLGEVRPGLSGSGICLGGGGAGAEYALVAFNSNPDSSNQSSLPIKVTANGASGVAVASIGASLDAAPGTPLALHSANDVQTAFDLRTRETARRELTRLMPAARMTSRQSAAFSAVPANPTIGSLVTLNANGIRACDSIKLVNARVAAVSNTAIVVADLDNPAGGFTDAEYQSFATTFDTLINPLDITNFGQPTDIDKNGKIVIFFTKEVNLLTPRGSAGVVGGFFFERDLFPLTSVNNIVGCPGSNFSEMFYVLVPDSGHAFGDARTKQKVLQLTPGTLAHEYQHLINAGRRLYVNAANDFEEVWLNEGLSHIAEELLYYHISGFAPRQNLAASKIGQSQTSADVFNNYQGDNSGRFETFIGKPSQTSVYGANDSLETRGATWNLLRYLADHRGSSDADSWLQLVNTPRTGLDNLSHVFGTTYMTQIRDWATSVFADDVPGVTDTRFLEPSWNMRDIFPHLVNSSGTPLGKYPLAVVSLSDAAPATLSVYSGGAAYLRFSVPANGQASIDWSATSGTLSPFFQFSLVRTK